MTNLLMNLDFRERTSRVGRIPIKSRLAVDDLGMSRVPRPAAQQGCFALPATGRKVEDGCGHN